MVNCVRRKANISVALPLVAAVMLAALAFGQAAVHAQTDDTIVFALTSEPTNLNPIFLDINAGNWKMFNGLMKFDQNLRPVPDLARELPTVSDDGKIVTVKLRTDVHFHDGEPLTAEDVVFTWKAIVDPQVLTPIRAGLAVGDLIEDVRALDDYTVQFTLSRRDPAFIEKLYVGVVPSHLLAGEDLNTTRFNRAPVGTGPFVFKEWTPGSRIVLEANLDYFAGPVGLDRVVYVFVSDENSRAAMLRSGTVDVPACRPGSRRSLQTTRVFKW